MYLKLHVLMLGVEWASDCQEMPIPSRSDLITWLELIGEQVLTSTLSRSMCKSKHNKGKKFKVARAKHHLSF